jgi:PTH1 family peptidyl-tRNA hydrolase
VYLIAGLGNPGLEYKDTRHNIGFQVIKLWSRELKVPLKGRRFKSRNTRTQFQGNDIILLRPVTFMNESGKSIRSCAEFYNLNTDHILIIHDDLDLPVGKVKVVRNGGAGGHRGVSSIIQHLGSLQFPRIKVGIGRPRRGEVIEDYVLSPFYNNEKEIMKRAIRAAVRACELFVSVGVESAMNHINCQNLANKEVIS